MATLGLTACGFFNSEDAIVVTAEAINAENEDDYKLKGTCSTPDDLMTVTFSQGENDEVEITEVKCETDKFTAKGQPLDGFDETADDDEFVKVKVVSEADGEYDGELLKDTKAPVLAESEAFVGNGDVKLGKSIEITVAFDSIVVVDSKDKKGDDADEPILEITVNGAPREATLDSGSGSKELVFTYKTNSVAGSDDTVGAVAVTALKDAHKTVKDEAGNPVDGTAVSGDVEESAVIAAD